MNGDSAAPTVAAAYAFGARDFPVSEVVTRLARQGDVSDPAHRRGWFVPRPGLEDYLRLGYVPNTVLEPGRSQPLGASTTLEYAVDDFAVAQLATAAGRTALAARYRARSASWRSLLDTDRGLLLPRDGDGAFPAPGTDVTACCSGFDEGNAAQYVWSGVPQDMGGLVGALGPDGVTARLDSFFTRLNDGANGAHAWLGNQPSLATPWAYHWVGEPAHTQDVVDRARAELWSTTPAGLPGNDDLGALSAWYVWTSLGLYPLTPGTANVAVGVPAFPGVTVRPSLGPATRIVRTGDARHVEELRVDGADRTASWLYLGPAAARPREIVIGTTDAAAPAWGSRAGDAPPSYPAP
jgi:putative alpha-1,2-mannosidase